jgi:hypothetical protein
MRTRCARSTVCLITLFVTLTSVRGGADAKVSTDEAKRLFHRFLDRLKDDAPVTGEFEIKRTSMPGWGKGMPQRNRLLRCRWSWEPDREMLEGLPESNVFEHFLSTRTAFLQAMGPLNYNISKPNDPASFRPASFYFLFGGSSWFSMANADVSLVASDADTPPSTKVLRVNVRHGYAHLFIREPDARHLGHDTFLEDKLFHRLRISKLVTFSDGRAFPFAAKLESYRGTKHRELFFTDELRTIRVQFPRGAEQIQAAFATDLPAGSQIHDNERNTHITLRSVTSAIRVIPAAGSSLQPGEQSGR